MTRRWTMARAAASALVLVTACEKAPEGPTSPSDVPPTASASHIPTDYVLIGSKGTTALAVPPRDGRAETGAGIPLRAGFGFVVSERRNAGGRRYARLGKTGWVPADELIPVRPSTFAGTAVAHGALDATWVIVPEAVVRATPDLAARAIVSRPFHARITLTGSCRGGWCPLAVGWMRSSDLARAALAQRPAGLGPTERWLDLDLSSQTLVAYQGDRPVLATLVSTGIGVGDSPFATPTGTFTIRSKAELVRMDNLEHTGVVPYSYDVPLAQYFNGGKALHAALWHDRFGRPTSHGCVNLSPRDADWLFDFTEVRAGAAGAGTTIRVHGERPTVAAR